MSGSKTPPRSLSPSRKGSISEKGAPNKVELLSSFPPCRRSALLELKGHKSGAYKDLVISDDPSLETLRDNSLPTTRTYNRFEEPLKYTPAGFSTADIVALGDFPPYDILSGVPLPEAYEGFNHETALPRPYRPFRWAYHQTMCQFSDRRPRSIVAQTDNAAALTKMETDWWLEVDKDYCAKIAERKGLYQKYGKLVLDYQPGSELACKELMEMALQFYCARYPKHFQLSNDNTVFHNKLLNTSTIIANFHPLVVIMNNIAEDFALVLRSEADGQYYFRAGCICSSLGWNVSTKIGKSLFAIHAGIVPDYEEKMAFSMDRFFTKMPTSSPIQRGSWSLEAGAPLFMPPGDPHEASRAVQAEALRADEVTLRVDWQTLRRLPLSGAVVFNFKALFTPLAEFRDEAYIPALVLKICKEGKENLMAYKNTWHVEHVAIPELERYAEEQREKGMVRGEKEGEEWTVETLAASPYFPGWEEKWHRQQGF